MDLTDDDLRSLQNPFEITEADLLGLYDQTPAVQITSSLPITHLIPQALR